MKLDICTAPKRNSRHWENGTTTWDDVLHWGDSPGSTKESGNYIFGRLKESEQDHGDGPCTNLHRSHTTVASRSAITLDADSPGTGLRDVTELVVGALCLGHTTFNSTPEDPRYRLIYPTDRDMTPDEYVAASSVLMDMLGRERFDPGSTQPERYMFMPATQKPEWFEWWAVSGEPVRVDDLVAQYTPPDNPRIRVQKRDPMTLGGVVGAFNRAYTFDDAIRAFDLPYSTVGDHRWQLVGATTAAGMSLVAEGLVYSHHANDPAGGQACSAFDLVRLHRYGHLDTDADAKTPVNRKPSYKAMSDYASTDPRVIAELVGVDFEQAMDHTIATDWKLQLSMHPRTGKVRDSIDNWDLVADNDPVFTGLYRNQMTLAVESRHDFPWRSVADDPTVTSADKAAIAHHLEREYDHRLPRSFVEELIIDRANRRAVNPVKSYLEGLQWDGESRLETCLPGVTPTPYTRMVARKSLMAAVARMLDPGCKWDHSLVLYGDEGLGKSWWVHRMSRGYSASLGRIGDKDTLLTMQRSWIMVSDEGHSLRKADAEVQKEFLTRTEDVFRIPYEREATLHKRRCVVWSTTNDEVFLRRQEGNRRFLIVRCEKPVDFHALTDHYVDQVWAEAVHLYREATDGVYLTPEENAMAGDVREGFTEEDALGGIIQRFLDTPVPAEWDEMSSEARLTWMYSRAEGSVPPGVVMQTETCSAQLWVEALGQRLGDHRRTDLLDIVSALKRIPGWYAVPGRHRVPNYGPQLIFRRDSTPAITTDFD